MFAARAWERGARSALSLHWDIAALRALLVLSTVNVESTTYCGGAHQKKEIAGGGGGGCQKTQNTCKHKKNIPF